MSIVFAHDGEAHGFESLATGTAIGFTTSYLNLASIGGVPMRAALITVETADIRFTLDGTTPTITAGTAVGHLAASGQSYVVRGYDNIRNFKCINAVAGSGAVVKCTFFY
jgi:hypothetical protein